MQMENIFQNRKIFRLVIPSLLQFPLSILLMRLVIPYHCNSDTRILYPRAFRDKKASSVSKKKRHERYNRERYYDCCRLRPSILCRAPSCLSWIHDGGLMEDGKDILRAGTRIGQSNGKAGLGCVFDPHATNKTESHALLVGHGQRKM